jgi:hypothetical protein
MQGGIVVVMLEDTVQISFKNPCFFFPHWIVTGLLLLFLKPEAG